LLKITKKALGPNKIPYIVTHDARTIRFPRPDIKIGDSVKFDIEKNNIVDVAKLEIGNLCYITGGNNIGRVGQIVNIQSHPGSFEIIHVKDSLGKVFSTRNTNIFVIGKGKKSWITLPKDNGIYLTALERKKVQEEARGGKK